MPSPIVMVPVAALAAAAVLLGVGARRLHRQQRALAGAHADLAALSEAGSALSRAARHAGESCRTSRASVPDGPDR